MEHAPESTAPVVPDVFAAWAVYFANMQSTLERQARLQQRDLDIRASALQTTNALLTANAGAAPAGAAEPDSSATERITERRVTATVINFPDRRAAAVHGAEVGIPQRAPQGSGRSRTPLTAGEVFRLIFERIDGGPQVALDQGRLTTFQVVQTRRQTKCEVSCAAVSGSGGEVPASAAGLISPRAHALPAVASAPRSRKAAHPSKPRRPCTAWHSP